MAHELRLIEYLILYLLTYSADLIISWPDNFVAKLNTSIIFDLRNLITWQSLIMLIIRKLCTDLTDLTDLSRY